MTCIDTYELNKYLIFYLNFCSFDTYKYFKIVAPSLHSMSNKGSFKKLAGFQSFGRFLFFRLLGCFCIVSISTNILIVASV